MGVSHGSMSFCSACACVPRAHQAHPPCGSEVSVHLHFLLGCRSQEGLRLFLLPNTLPAPHELVVFAHVLDGLPPAAHLSVSR